METYTIFLLKENVITIEEALDTEKHPRPHPLSADESPVSGILFVGEQNRATPPWVQKLNPFLEEPLENLLSANVSAVLIVSYEERFFALTFGHGKSLLEPTSMVRDFGLRVTLNLVDPSGLRSMDSKIYDDLVVMTRKQTSRSSSQNSFELDVGRSLLRGVTGDAIEGSPFRRLTGGDGLHLTTDLSFDQLDELLSEVMIAYDGNTYTTHFPWFDNIREADPSMTSSLDELLLTSLGSGNTTDAYLAPVEIVDWANIDAFSYTRERSAVSYPELNLYDYLQIVQWNRISLTVEILKRHRVRVRNNGSADWRDIWSIYDCLVWDTTFQNRRHVLFDGRWFSIESNFADEIDSFVTNLHSTSIAFPNAQDGQREGVYNTAMVDATPNTYALLDLEPFTPTGAVTPIEFCDILSSDRKIIHVKKRSSSATLSHLFSQGSVSAELFLQDPDLREQVHQKLIFLGKTAHAQLITHTPPPIAAHFEVVYAIIARTDQHGLSRRLPFFSAVNLTHHARRMQNLGFHVSLQYIRQV